METRTTQAVQAAIAIILAAIAGAQTPALAQSPEDALVGRWTGSWKNGNHHDIEITSITPKGPFGRYCVARADGTTFGYRITPHGPAVEAWVENGAIAFDRAGRQHRFLLERPGLGRLHQSHNEKTSKLWMRPTEHGTCLQEFTRPAAW